MTTTEPTVGATVEHEMQILSASPSTVTFGCTCDVFGAETLVADPPSLSNALLTRAVLIHAAHVRAMS